MDNLKEKIKAEEQNINVALDNLKKALKKRKITVIELSAIGAFLCNFYNGIENILKQILKAKDKRISNSANWHKNLIKLSLDSGIISREISIRLNDYLTFRHFFIHGYAFNLKWSKIKLLVDGIDELWLEMRKCVKKFINTQGNKKEGAG